MKPDPEWLPRARELRAREVPYQKISKILGAPATTIRLWVDPAQRERGRLRDNERYRADGKNRPKKRKKRPIKQINHMPDCILFATGQITREELSRRLKLAA